MNNRFCINKGSRNVGLDIIRSFAIFFVIAEHFYFLHTPLREVPFKGISLFIQATALSLFFIGVPLFVMLTGYLNINKSVSKKYYKGMIRVLFSYLLFSIITILFRKYYIHETLSWMEWILKILDFSAIPYGWYIEMWIGLFLLTPFFNVLYKNINGKRHKLLFIGTLFVMTIVPHWLNRYGMHLLPGDWTGNWPLTFYFVGAYIKEYQPTVNKMIAGLVAMGTCLISPILNRCLSSPSLLLLGGGHEDVCSFVIAISFFLIFYKCQIKYCRSLISKISILSLDMYLCCYIFDALFYPVFIDAFYHSQAQFGIAYFGILVPLVFTSSFLVALLKNIIFKK